MPLFGAEPNDFCDNNNLCFIDKETLLPDSFSFVSQAHGIPFWLDHCITTASGKSITSNISNIVCSDHFPLCIEIVCDINKLCDLTSEIKSRETIKWHAATDLDKQEYNTETEKLASPITLPIDALQGVCLTVARGECISSRASGTPVTTSPAGE